MKERSEGKKGGRKGRHMREKRKVGRKSEEEKGGRKRRKG